MYKCILQRSCKRVYIYIYIYIAISNNVVRMAPHLMLENNQRKSLKKFISHLGNIPPRLTFSKC